MSKALTRFRYWFIFFGMALATGLMLYADPLDGARTFEWLISTSRFVFGVACIFFGYRALADYPEADGQDLHKVASQSPEGAGQALVHRGLVLVAMAIVFLAVCVA